MNSVAHQHLDRFAVQGADKPHRAIPDGQKHNVVFNNDTVGIEKGAIALGVEMITIAIEIHYRGSFR